MSYLIKESNAFIHVEAVAETSIESTAAIFSCFHGRRREGKRRRTEAIRQACLLLVGRRLEELYGGSIDLNLCGIFGDVSTEEIGRLVVEWNACGHGGSLFPSVV